MIFSKGPFLQKLLYPLCNIVLEKLNQSFIQMVRFEQNAASKIEVYERNKGWVLNLKVHGLEYGPLRLLIVNLAETLIRISLVSIEIGHVLI